MARPFKIPLGRTFPIRYHLVGRRRAVTCGGMAEWPIAPALKAGSLTASWVRIPVPPCRARRIPRRAKTVRGFEACESQRPSGARCEQREHLESERRSREQRGRPSRLGSNPSPTVSPRTAVSGERLLGSEPETDRAGAKLNSVTPSSRTSITSDPRSRGPTSSNRYHTVDSPKRPVTLASGAPWYRVPHYL